MVVWRDAAGSTDAKHPSRCGRRGRGWGRGDLAVARFALALLLAAVGAAASFEAAALDLIASHVNPPGEPTYEAFQRMADRLAQGESGLRLRLFPRGQLGDEKDIIEQVRLGAISMASVSTAALSAFSPATGVLDIPFLMRDHDHHPWVVADGPLGR